MAKLAQYFMDVDSMKKSFRQPNVFNKTGFRHSHTKFCKHAYGNWPELQLRALKSQVFVALVTTLPVMILL